MQGALVARGRPCSSRQLRRAFWSAELDGDLAADAAALRLLQAEALAAVHAGTVPVPPRLLGVFAEKTAAGNPRALLEVRGGDVSGHVAVVFVEALPGSFWRHCPGTGATAGRTWLVPACPRPTMGQSPC